MHRLEISDLSEFFTRCGSTLASQADSQARVVAFYK
jgi:hypothetical protein